MGLLNSMEEQWTTEMKGESNAGLQVRDASSDCCASQVREQRTPSLSIV